MPRPSISTTGCTTNAPSNTRLGEASVPQTQRTANWSSGLKAGELARINSQVRQGLKRLESVAGGIPCDPPLTAAKRGWYPARKILEEAANCTTADSATDRDILFEIQTAKYPGYTGRFPTVTRDTWEDYRDRKIVRPGRLTATIDTLREVFNEVDTNPDYTAETKYNQRVYRPLDLADIALDIMTLADDGQREEWERMEECHATEAGKQLSSLHGSISEVETIEQARGKAWSKIFQARDAKIAHSVPSTGQ